MVRVQYSLGCLPEILDTNHQSCAGKRHDLEPQQEVTRSLLSKIYNQSSF
ncbi:hypothetical protein H6G27_20320 [Nostoc linckia FACHB-104]|nr:hypothetical protein [Nostoc linckia FACHB-104]